VYGYPSVAFEVMKNGHLASVTLWKVSARITQAELRLSEDWEPELLGAWVL